MSEKNEKETWLALSAEFGEALLDAERTFMNVVEQFGSLRSQRDETLRAYLDAWRRLSTAHETVAGFLTNQVTR